MKQKFPKGRAQSVLAPHPPHAQREERQAGARKGDPHSRRRRQRKRTSLAVAGWAGRAGLSSGTLPG